MQKPISAEIQYTKFLRRKIPQAESAGFEPKSPAHPAVSAHARDIARWLCRGGRRAEFATAQDPHEPAMR